MKFTDRYSQLRDGVQARYPAQVYDVTAEPDALLVYAPTLKIEHRGDTLNEPLLTVRCTSPAPDVISVSVSHFVGAGPRLPQFRMSDQPRIRADGHPTGGHRPMATARDGAAKDQRPGRDRSVFT